MATGATLLISICSSRDSKFHPYQECEQVRIRLVVGLEDNCCFIDCVLEELKNVTKEVTAGAML